MSNAQAAEKLKSELTCVGRFFFGGFYKESGENGAKTFTGILDNHQVEYTISTVGNEILVRVDGEQLEVMKNLGIENKSFEEPRR